MLCRAEKYGDPAFWVRAVHMAGFQFHSITAVVRPGDRMKDPVQPTSLPVGVDIPVRFIKKSGNQGLGVAPEFYPDGGMTIRITEGIVKPIGELTKDDLRGMAPDTATSELVRYHLATLYDKPLPSEDELVTIWRFEYRPDAIE